MIKKKFVKVHIEETYLNIRKAIHDKPTVNIILNGEKLKAFPLKSGTRQEHLLLPLLLNLVVEVLASTIRQEKEIKGIKIEMEGIKLSLFAADMMLQKTLKSPQKTIRTNNFSDEMCGWKLFSLYKADSFCL